MKIIFLILFIINLSASTLNMNYIGELSLFGKVANATIYYFNDGVNYHIKVSGTGSGIVAKLTNNKRYVYESVGRVKNRELIPSKYSTSEISSDGNKTKVYRFDYKNLKVDIESSSVKKITKSEFNIFTLKFDESSKTIVKSKKKTINKIYKDDMVSMFFNKRNRLLFMKENENKTIYAIGSKDTQKGVVVKLVDIENGKFTYSMNLKKDYLDDGAEEAKFILDSDNILCETSLDGILFFGDAVIKRLN